MRNLKIGASFAVIFALLLPLLVMPASANILGIATFLFSFFTSRPEKVVTSKGSFEVRLTIPVEYREAMHGLKYLYARPMKLEGEREGGGFNFIIPHGWDVEVTAWFPTEGERPDRGYFNLDNVHYGDIKAPFKYKLDTQDVENSHMLEMGVEVGRGGGSVNLTYRCQTLANMYREWLTEKDNSLGQLTLDQFRAEQRGTQAQLTVVVQNGRNSTVPTSVMIEVDDQSGVVHRGQIFGSKSLTVTPGPIQIYTAPGMEFSGELRSNGVAVPLKAGACDVSSGSSSTLVLWPKGK